jgi:hypothetical protein
MYYHPTNSKPKLVDTLYNKDSMIEFLDLREQLAKAMNFHTKRHGNTLVLLDNTKEVGVYYAKQSKQKED